MRSSKPVLLATIATMFMTACSEREATVIPIEIIDGNPITTAKIGEVSIDLVVDTGGFGALAIAPKYLAQLDVNVTEEFIKRTDAVGNEFESREFIAPVLTLGNSEFKSVRGFERLSASSGITGGTPINVLGRNFLHKFAVVIDYPNNKIELHDLADVRRVCGEPTASLKINEDDQFFLTIATDHGDMNALMDTGATYSFIKQTTAQRKNIDIVDDLYTSTMLKIGDNDLGPLEMVALPFNGVKVKGIDVLIGSNFFTRHRVCFDYVHHTVSIR